jgi:hypothetical protein
LYRCLYAMTPNPRSPAQDSLILTHWTMNHLTGESDVVMKPEGKRQSTKCLLVVLYLSTIRLEFSVKAHRRVALYIVDGDNSGHTATLEGRQVDPLYGIPISLNGGSLICS